MGRMALRRGGLCVSKDAVWAVQYDLPLRDGQSMTGWLAPPRPPMLSMEVAPWSVESVRWSGAGCCSGCPERCVKESGM